METCSLYPWSCYLSSLQVRWNSLLVKPWSLLTKFDSTFIRPSLKRQQYVGVDLRNQIKFYPISDFTNSDAEKTGEAPDLLESASLHIARDVTFRTDKLLKGFHQKILISDNFDLSFIKSLIHGNNLTTEISLKNSLMRIGIKKQHDNFCQHFCDPLNHLHIPC